MEKQGYKTVTGKVPGFRVFAQFVCCQYKDPKTFDGGYMDPPGALADPQVRKALSKAVNRDELNKAFFAGHGKPIYNYSFNPSWPGWNPDWEKRFQAEYGYDPQAAQALLADPHLVFLDEPTSALDPIGRRDVRDIIRHLRDKGVTVFLNSHLLSEVEQVCDRAAIVRGGQVLALGTMDDLLRTTDVVDVVAVLPPGVLDGIGGAFGGKKPAGGSPPGK